MLDVMAVLSCEILYLLISLITVTSKVSSSLNLAPPSGLCSLIVKLSVGFDKGTLGIVNSITDLLSPFLKTLGSGEELK